MLFTVNQMLQNKHAHVYGNEIITHSHPLEKNNDAPIKSHNHTQAEIFFYGLIAFDYFAHSEEQFFETGTISTPNIFIPTEEQSPYIVWLYNTDSRDPPAENC